jgi:hypothetical protein
MDIEELRLAGQRAMAPSVMHFLVCPHSPKSGALLNKYGVPVLTDYNQVDWQGLANAARAAIEKDVPKSIGLFIADDAVDVMDVLRISTDSGRPFKNEPPFEHLVQSTLSQLSMKDMRSGITKISDKHPGVHINSPMDGKRPPLGALILSIKFTRGTQIIDYLTGATMSLFGVPAMVATFEGYKPAPTTGEMPSFLREWLDSQFGVIYGKDCTVMAIQRTFSV